MELAENNNLVTFCSFVIFFILYSNKYIHKEIKSRLNLGSTCYHSVQNLFSSSILPKNAKIKILV